MNPHLMLMKLYFFRQTFSLIYFWSSNKIFKAILVKMYFGVFLFYVKKWNGKRCKSVICMSCFYMRLNNVWLVGPHIFPPHYMFAHPCFRVFVVRGLYLGVESQCCMLQILQQNLSFNPWIRMWIQSSCHSGWEGWSFWKFAQYCSSDRHERSLLWALISIPPFNNSSTLNNLKWTILPFTHTPTHSHSFSDIHHLLRMRRNLAEVKWGKLLETTAWFRGNWCCSSELLHKCSPEGTVSNYSIKTACICHLSMTLAWLVNDNPFGFSQNPSHFPEKLHPGQTCTIPFISIPPLPNPKQTDHQVKHYSHLIKGRRSRCLNLLSY